ncbi:MAG TPA: GNAT family N-acetyltransferase [Oculatellaceae cyanobacterium]
MLTAKLQDYQASEVLADGSQITVRALHPEDKPILQEGMHHLSKNSLYNRFFTWKTELSPKELSFFTELDFVDHVGLLASLVTPEGERPLGVGRYIACKELKSIHAAEIAFAVDEEFQGRGIGKLLMKHLIVIGRQNHVKLFVAYVLPGNRKMLAVLYGSGLPVTRNQDEAGVLEIRLRLT